MAAVHMERKFAGILPTDVTGYNRLMGEAEGAIGRIGWPQKARVGTKVRGHTCEITLLLM
jgi:hypothetical protein